jgi:hypothetical protein
MEWLAIYIMVTGMAVRRGPWGSARLCPYTDTNDVCGNLPGEENEGVQKALLCKGYACNGLEGCICPAGFTSTKCHPGGNSPHWSYCEPSQEEDLFVSSVLFVNDGDEKYRPITKFSLGDTFHFACKFQNESRAGLKITIEWPLGEHTSAENDASAAFARGAHGNAGFGGDQPILYKTVKNATAKDAGTYECLATRDSYGVDITVATTKLQLEFEG